MYYMIKGFIEDDIVMTLKISENQNIPSLTAQVAKSSFPKGNKYLRLRDQLGCIFTDHDFIDLFPAKGQPAIAPWRLALVTVLQFGESLSDRQAADAVRARIDWKYLLGLEVDDSGFDYSVLSEFRQRLLFSDAEDRLLSVLLTKFVELGILKSNGNQRTDSSHVLASVRTLNRLELIGETMRAALNYLAKEVPEWLITVANDDWYKKYGHRVENSRLPKSDPKKEEYAVSVGKDGFKLMDALDKDSTVKKYLNTLQLEALKTAWDRHFIRDDATGDIRFKSNKEVSLSEKKIESPYDTDARFRTKRETNWTGYVVHLTETCDEDAQINVITHVMTTPADVHDINATPIIQKELHAANLTPKNHIVDTAYINLELLVESKQKYNIDLIGQPKEGPTWRSKIEGGYTLDKFKLDWDNEQTICPEGKVSTCWSTTKRNDDYITAVFSSKDCSSCPTKHLCIKGESVTRRTVNFPSKEKYEAKQALLSRLETDDGKALYDRRAGVEGTVSQGVRGTGLRKSRYRGLEKTHLQQVAGAAAMNIFRLAEWLDEGELAKTRKSNFQKIEPKAA